MLAVMLAALDATIVATALPTIVRELGGLEHLAWVATAYLLAQTAVTPLYGKLGDLYGRKSVLQAAIGIFLLGSALCGMSRSMLQLILFRGIQGLGGGGLIITAQAVVADIVPPRDRGRYQGLFGAVFGLASVAGPLVGGFFTTQMSWRWIFYVNLPFGVLAAVVIGAVLPANSRRSEHGIDYPGAVFLATAVTAIILLCDLGVSALGNQPAFAATVALAAVSVAAFFLAERHAKEPVLPMRLFGDRTVAITCATSFIVGFALFGSVTYLPLFLQTVRGVSPTSSGLHMLPMLIGMPAMSMMTGILVSRTGRYKRYPIAGTALAVIALFALARIDANTSWVALSAMFLGLGLGLGLIMQVLVTAVQNSVPYADLGAATAVTMLARLIGGSMGTAIVGAIFSARMTSIVAGGGTAAEGVTAGIHMAFAGAAIVAVVAAVLVWFLPEKPLRETVAALSADPGESAGEAFAMPMSDDAGVQVLRGLSALADQSVQRGHVEAIVKESGIDVDPFSAWLLWQIGSTPHVRVDALGVNRGVDRQRRDDGVKDLAARGWIQLDTNDPCGPASLTPLGNATFEQFADARRRRFERLFASWNPADRVALAEVMRSFATGVAGEAVEVRP
jgi:EmrB/QacA subfamily drug resistance transporter